MKKLLFVLATIFAINVSTAQTTTITYGPELKQPDEKARHKLLQLKNGNTFHLYFSRDNAIEVWVYNKDHKQTSYKKLTSDLWVPKKLGNARIEAIYEIDGKPTIFLHQILKRTPHLYRIVLDNQTGAIENETNISTLEHVDLAGGYAIGLGGVGTPGFMVEKDAYSDAYAIINFRTFASNSDERIEVVHYNVINGEHKEINRAFCGAQGYKYNYPESMCVIGTEQVVLNTYLYDTKSSGGERSGMFISSLNKGSENFEHQELDLAKENTGTYSIMKYNKNLGQICMLLRSNQEVSKENWESSTRIIYINPSSLQAIKENTILDKYADQYIKDKLIPYDKNEYPTKPLNFIINKNNSLTILSQKRFTHTVTRYTKSSSYQYDENLLGPSMVTHINETGIETAGFAVNKKQRIRGKEFDYFYNYNKEKGMSTYAAFGTPLRNDEFAVYDYITAGSSEYIIYNDVPENLQKDKKKAKEILGFFNSSAILCKYDNGNITTEYLFKKPYKGEHTFAFIGSSDFCEETQTYAVLVLQQKSRANRKARVAWVKFN